eukprot:scaffold492_cov99-Amphora_coffeaeformis.AAC.7
MTDDNPSETVTATRTSSPPASPHVMMILPEAATDPAMDFAAMAAAKAISPPQQQQQESNPGTASSGTRNMMKHPQHNRKSTSSSGKQQRQTEPRKSLSSKKQGRSRKSATKKGTATTIMVSSSLSSSSSPPKPAARRRTSTGSSSRNNNNNNNNPKYPLPCADVRPHRLTNPLLMAPRTAADVVALSDLYHPLPDTWSLAYAARLLGFHVPPTAATEDASRTVDSLRMRRDDSYQQVPPLGQFATAVWQAPVSSSSSSSSSSSQKQQQQQQQHGSPNVEDQQTLDVLDPMYESLLLLSLPNNTTQDDDEQESSSLLPEEWTRPVTKRHTVRLWEWLVEGCSGTNTNTASSAGAGATTANRNSGSSKKPKATASASPTATTTTTTINNSSSSTLAGAATHKAMQESLQQIQQLTGQSFTVHAYRSAAVVATEAAATVNNNNTMADNNNNNNNNNTKTTADCGSVEPPIDLQGLPPLPTEPPLGIIVSSGGQARGALLFRYEWYVTGPARNQASLMIRWEHLALCQAEIDSDASSLVALTLIALSMQHARHAGSVHYGTYDVPTSNITTATTTTTTTTTTKEKESATDTLTDLD